MSEMGGGAGFYGNLPDSYNLVINTAHPLIKKILKDSEKANGKKVVEIRENKDKLSEEKNALQETHSELKPEEVPP